MNVLIGGTGFLGNAVAEEMVKRKLPLRCLVRKDSDTSKLKQLGVELFEGDARDNNSLKKVTEGAESVISSFTTRLFKRPKAAYFWDNDYQGNFNLIQLAREQKVKKYIFVSYWGLAKFGDFEHGKAKKSVEDLLKISGLDYTIFRVTTLATDMSVLLGNSLKKKGWAPMFMKREEKVRPILLEDLARCMVDALDNKRASYKVVEVAGEEEYTFVELRDLFSKVLDKKVRFVFVPSKLAYFVAGIIDILTDRVYNAKGLVSAFTGGSTCDISEMKDIFSINQGSFAKYLEDYFQNSPGPEKK
ncbi:MAG: NmrA family NAD(P)-binding protein [Deltaproteobacteria bacterium]|jgi:NADH dehydrogenase|nr:NmrA family NAD(P)-binding protein [Deltaproteobacteria bacterium]NOQ85724.1 NAD(P)H-binding protein [Deltaproteobacteria bacterium]